MQFIDLICQVDIMISLYTTRAVLSKWIQIVLKFVEFRI